MSDTFFFTDIHGNIAAYNLLKNFCLKKPNDMIIYGGDACDRGENGYAIMVDLLNHPQIIYLKGNHEQLFMNAAKELLAFHRDKVLNIFEYEPETLIELLATNGDYWNHYIQLHLRNGGAATLRDWLKAGAPSEILDKLSSLPYVYSYQNIDFSHAGLPPKAFTELKENPKPSPFAIEKSLWDREHEALGWFEGRIHAHGHTPVFSLSKKIRGDTILDNARPQYWRGLVSKETYPGYRLDMDTGVTWNNRAYVLNCTTKTITGFNCITNQLIEEYTL